MVDAYYCDSPALGALLPTGYCDWALLIPLFGVNASSRLQNGQSPGCSSYCFTGIAPLHRLHFTITWPVSLARYEMASSRGRLAMCFSRSIDLCDCRPILPSSMQHLPSIAPFGFVCMGRFVVVLQPALPPLAASPNKALEHNCRPASPIRLVLIHSYSQCRPRSPSGGSGSAFSFGDSSRPHSGSVPLGSFSQAQCLCAVSAFQ